MKEFKIYSIIHRNQQGKLEGFMGPILAIKSVMDDMESPWNRAARVTFDDETVHNWYEAPGKRELTGCDTLLAANIIDGEIESIAMIVDMGHAICPVAIWFPEDTAATLSVTLTYQRDKTFERKLDNYELIDVFKAAAENPDTFMIIEK